CEIEWRAVTGRTMAAGIDGQIFNAQLLATARTCSLQQRTDAGEEFGKREKFYQIIVRAHLKSFYAIAKAVARGEEKNRRPKSFVAKFLDKRPSIFLWKHYVDNQEIELAAARQVESGIAVGAGLSAKAGFTKSLREKRGRLFLVFDDQDPHKSIYITKRPPPRKRPFWKNFWRCRSYGNAVPNRRTTCGWSCLPRRFCPGRLAPLICPLAGAT